MKPRPLFDRFRPYLFVVMISGVLMSVLGHAAKWDTVTQVGILFLTGGFCACVCLENIDRQNIKNQNNQNQST